MRCFVTGTTGFIGNRLATELENRGHNVTVLERYIAGRAPYSERRFKTVFADLNDHFAINQIIRQLKPEVVFHLAAISPVSYSYEHPKEVIETNTIATAVLAEACMREGSTKHFLFASTSEVYGNQNSFPVKETAELRPNSPYSLSKVAADRYLRFMWDAYEFPVTIVRPFNTYGRINDRHFVTESIITQMLDNEDAVKLGDPEPIRDLMYVDDHVNAYVACFEQPEESIGETFNFGTGRGVTVRELADILGGVLEFKGEILWNTIPKRPNDIKCLIADAGKAYRGLGWKAHVQLEDGLRKTIEKLKEKKKHEKAC